MLNPGEISLVPDPCYPVYRSSSMFAGADVYTMPLEPAPRLSPRSRRHSRRRLRAGPVDVPQLPQQPDRRHGRPAVLSRRSSSWRRPHDFVIAQDAAYNEMYYEQPAPSILQVPGAKDVAIEFHSLSKTFNMTGWRVGFAIGGAPLIAALGQVKANTDSGIFTAIQFAGKTALDEYHNLTPPIRALYKERRDAFVGALQSIGWEVPDAPGDLLRLDPLPQRDTPRPSCAPGCSTRPTS